MVTGRHRYPCVRHQTKLQWFWPRLVQSSNKSADSCLVHNLQNTTKKTFLAQASEVNIIFQFFKDLPAVFLNTAVNPWFNKQWNKLDHSLQVWRIWNYWWIFLAYPRRQSRLPNPSSLGHSDLLKSNVTVTPTFFCARKVTRSSEKVRLVSVQDAQCGHVCQYYYEVAGFGLGQGPRSWEGISQQGKRHKHDSCGADKLRKHSLNIKKHFETVSGLTW